MASSWITEKIEDGKEWYLRFPNGRHGIIRWQRKMIDGVDDDLQGKGSEGMEAKIGRLLHVGRSCLGLSIVCHVRRKGNGATECG